MLLLYLNSLLSHKHILNHLHSTMLLLYQYRANRKRLYQSIFTFHYASTLSNYLKTTTDILPHLHSTMLLLYPTGNPTFEIAVTIFTFHYASTLSERFRSTQKSCMIFTFHYASTLSAEIAFIVRIRLHLHSTMLLLYLPSKPQTPILKHIYIPLCFYFILDRPLTISCDSDLHSTMLLLYRSFSHRSKIAAAKFTFHYASTLSD